MAQTLQPLKQSALKLHVYECILSSHDNMFMDFGEFSSGAAALMRYTYSISDFLNGMCFGKSRQRNKVRKQAKD